VQKPPGAEDRVRPPVGLSGSYLLRQNALGVPVGEKKGKSDAGCDAGVGDDHGKPEAGLRPGKRQRPQHGVEGKNRAPDRRNQGVGAVKEGMAPVFARPVLAGVLVCEGRTGQERPPGHQRQGSAGQHGTAGLKKWGTKDDGHRKMGGKKSKRHQLHRFDLPLPEAVGV